MGILIKHLFLLILTCVLALPAAYAQEDSPSYADPNIAIHKTMLLEGGYVHEPRARGGQIYRGITRVSHPQWEGWKTVDQLKLKRGETNADLDQLAETFYKTRYWDYIRASELTNQQTANKYFNTSVKLGLDRGIMRAQRSVGLPATGTVTDELITRLNSGAGLQSSSPKKGKTAHRPKKRGASHSAKKHHTTHRTHSKHK